MSFKKFKAHRIFDGEKMLPEETVLITDASGNIEALVPENEAGGDVQTFEGIILPGLINCHCHLELSHLKNVIPPHTGLINFLCSVVTKRDFPREEILEKMAAAENEMYENGIVAVGDIGNTADTLSTKKKSKIWWQNFTEVLSFTDAAADKNFLHYKTIAEEMKKSLAACSLQHRTSLVPHAPYSISPKTFAYINAATKGKVISMHNQEHPAEDELYKTGGGEYLRFFKIFGIEKSPFPVTGKSSIRSVLPHFNNGQTIFLVHNTFMPEEDVIWANDFAKKNNLELVYCICINANLYIENKVPPIDMFLRHKCQVVLGTDSYSSNWQLSIAREMQAVQNHFPGISIEKILSFATGNGALALQKNDLGFFQKDKKPGVVVVAEDLSASKRLI